MRQPPRPGLGFFQAVVQLDRVAFAPDFGAHDDFDVVGSAAQGFDGSSGR